MEDFFKPRGPTKASQPDAGNANIRSVPVFAVVKDNIDPIRSGRLRVYIADFSGDDPNNAESWVTVSYMTPFYGRTNGNPPNTGYGNYKNNPHSYGMWTSPPDVGTTVICIFVNGDPNFGFWIGCVPDPDALHMVPAIGASNKIIANTVEADRYGGALFLPVTNINSNDPKIAQTSEFLVQNKPLHSYAATVFAQQGLIRDNIRGPITTNAQRESPSRVGFGISTPGRPIYEGGFTDETIGDAAGQEGQQSGLGVIGRRGGHTFIMDDGDLVGNDRLVRIRTTLGHQILLSDSGQCLHIIHANGQSWIELGKEGTIDMYSTNSVNIRTQGDLNLHADNNININAAKDLSIQAESIKINSEKSIAMKSGTDFTGYAMGKYTWKVDGPMAMAAGGEGSYASAGTMFVNGSKINLNTGSASTVPVTVPPLQTFAHTDTLYDSVKGFAAAPGRLVSIVSRAPAHAPWANAGQGVNVQTKLNAEDNLPKPAAPSVEATNAAAAAVTPPTPTIPTIATVPPTNPISNAVDKNATISLVSAAAVAAATGPAAAAVTQGVAVVEQAGARVAAVGAFAMSPKQMEDAGFLKPGSAEKVLSNINSGISPEKAFDPSFFTGKNGVSNLADFRKNIAAQTIGQVTNMQKAQTGLQNSGIMTGQESATQVGGPILAGSQRGVTKVIDAVKTVSGTIVGDIQTKLTAAKNALTAGNEIVNSIASGNFATKLSDKVTGGLSGIATSLTGMKGIPGLAVIVDGAKSVSEGAFKAITASFKSFKANVPVDTIAEAKKNSDVPEDPTIQSNNLAAKIPGEALKQVGSIASRASGVNNLPGGQQAIDAVVTGAGNFQAQTNSLVANVGNIAKQASTALTNNVSAQSIQQTIGGLKSLTEGLPGRLGGLSALANPQALAGNLAKNALSGLPPGLAAQIQNAIGSLGSGGSSIKIPQVAENTNDRASLDAGTASALGDPGIPPPNYSATLQDRIVSNTQIEATRNRLQASFAGLTAAQQNLNAAKDVVEKNKLLKKDYEMAYAEFMEAKKTLPEGDPKIEELRVKALEEGVKYQQNRIRAT
jgi:hypothetical protein